MMNRSGRLAVLGAGSWGTALALVLAPRFESAVLWGRSPRPRTTETFLPGCVRPENLQVTADLRAAVEGSTHLLIAVPSPSMRELVTAAAAFVRADVPIVSATKGLDLNTLQTMSEVIGNSLGHPERVAVLSGPTFAREVAAGEPTAVVIAARNVSLACALQQALSSESFRLYTTADVVGVEIGAALKNVIAIGAGICQGLGLGGNAVAALVTRGLAEITRLAVTMGGEAKTLSGLAGLGDLVLTATGDLSRNRHVGIELGRGKTLSEILAGMRMVAEGVGTTRAAVALGSRTGTSLPIVGEMYKVLYENKDPRTAIRHLMERPLTAE